jgi:hypothetical protein
MHRILLASFLFAICAHAANGEIYRYTDKNGHTVYSDKAPKSGNPIILPTINTTPAVEVTEPQRKASNTDQDKNSIQITSPRDGSIIPNGLVATTITISTDHPLRDGQQVRIRVDDRIVSTSTSTSFSIPQIQRGPHQISAHIIDRDGKSLSKSSINVTVYRPSN